LTILDRLIKSGVSALKVEGRQRNASYVSSVAGLFRRAIDAYYENPGAWVPPDFSGRGLAMSCFPKFSTTGCYGT